MSPDAPTLRSTKARIDELDAQIAEEKAILTSHTKDSGALASLLPKYEQLMVHNDFDEKLYELASDGLERARLRAAAQTIYVNVFVPPALPQDALYPERFASAAMVSLTLLILWGVGALTAALIQDHQL
jgi:capsular polysaccharide transport system permease protein